MRACLIEEFGSLERIRLGARAAAKGFRRRASGPGCRRRYQSDRLEACRRQSSTSVSGRPAAYSRTRLRGQVVSSDTPHFRVGDRVIAVTDARRNGTHAEFTLVSPNQACRVPDDISDLDAIGDRQLRRNRLDLPEGGCEHPERTAHPHPGRRGRGRRTGRTDRETWRSRGDRDLQQEEHGLCAFARCAHRDRLRRGRFRAACVRLRRRARSRGRSSTSTLVRCHEVRRNSGLCLRHSDRTACSTPMSGFGGRISAREANISASCSGSIAPGLEARRFFETFPSKRLNPPTASPAHPHAPGKIDPDNVSGGIQMSGFCRRRRRDIVA